ncbi:PLP-dependent cysteine synthase family protein [Longispora albida]|uniref:PLP-dependent cysteine synthase family protein n=1 Tax=Longispora albida TaxID=203523 RepID=UPI000366469E|nr:cysteine synthase family protein [Longispora albida]
MTPLVTTGLAGLVGGTPLLRITTPLPVPQPGFWAKLEYLSAGGMKARAAFSMVSRAKERGELRPGAVIVESTSGTLGVGLALAGTALGHPVILVVDDELEPVMRAMLRAHGARLEIVTEPDPVRGWQGARIDRLRAVLAEHDGAYWPDQYRNPDNPAGYASLAEELASQVEHAGCLVCSVGTGGHSAGLAAVLRKRWPGLRIVGVDTIGSAIFGQPARPRLMRGLGSSIYPRNVDYDLFDEVHWLAPAEVVDACRRLASGAFVSGGWSTGAVAAVAAWHARRAPEQQVVAVFPDGPVRYWQTVYDDGYCARHGLLQPALGTEPAELADPGAAEVTSWTRCTSVRDPLWSDAA